jgi:hypothetical protein
VGENLGALDREKIINFGMAENFGMADVSQIWHSEKMLDQSPTHLAIQAATAVAIAQGLEFEQAIVLQDSDNVVLHLAPTSVMARVATTTATHRPGDQWFGREVAVAKYLTEVGAPIIPVSPLVEPGPHFYLGLVLSFWQFVEVLLADYDPIVAGRTLKQCHDRLVDYPTELPPLALMTEAQEILQKLIAAAEFSATDAAMLERVGARSYDQLSQLPMQPIHGDAHFGNVLNTSMGVLWTDWEDTFWGPVEWDLASMVAASHVFGTDFEKAEAALQGYGRDFDLTALLWCIEARTFVALIWSIVLAKPHPSPTQQARIDRRLAWLRNSAETCI